MSDTASVRDRSEGGLVGRAAELASLRDAIESAARGAGGVVVVAGEAGIGKSALVELAARESAGLGFRVLTGRAWELGDAPAYLPLRGALRALGVTPPRPASTDAEAFGLWEDALEAVALEAARQPLLWVVEDLHAADARTLELLAYLAQPLRAMAALLVVTVRSGDPRATGERLARLTRLVRDGSTIELARVGRDEVSALAGRVLGRPLAASAVDEWVARTGGNPLFVVECARAMRAGRSPDRALPETIVQVVVERIRWLPEGTRACLAQGAVLGRELTAATVARALGLLPAAVVDGLLPALRTGLLEELAPGRYRFAHALVRDAIEGSMSRDARSRAHARAEAALGELGTSCDVLVERARHAIEALGELGEEHVIGPVDAAVEALSAEGAHDRALAVWKRFLDACAAAPDAARSLRTAELAIAAGSYLEGRAAAELAAAAARSSGDTRRLARAALACGTAVAPSLVDPKLVRLLEDALDALGSERDRGLACRVRARLAAAKQPAPDPAVPVAMAREAIADARALDDPDVLRDVLAHAMSAMSYFVDARDVRAIDEELGALAITAGDVPQALRAGVRSTLASLELGDVRGFCEETDRLIQLSRSVGHPAHVWRPLLVGSMRGLARGDLEESERCVTELEQLVQLCDDPALPMMLGSHELMRASTREDDAAMRRLSDTVLGALTAKAGPFRPIIHTFLAVRRHDRGAAGAEIDAMSQIVARLPRAQTHGILGEAVALAGTAEQRERCLAELLPFVGRQILTTPMGSTYEGPTARVIGLLEASLGRLDEADARLEAVRTECVALGLRPWVARLSLERGAVLASAGRTREARPLLDEAATLATELGMSVTARRARTEAGSSAVVSAPDALVPVTPGPAAPSLGLHRDGEVWCLTWGGAVVRVRDSRGVQLLAKLVAAPGERIHALALAADAEGFVPDSDAGPAVDRRALDAYRARLGSLDDELARAEGHADLGRAGALRREREALVGEITRAVGLGGRLRKIGSASERARINVTRRLKDAISRIAEVSPALGRHLQTAVRTGTYCSYL